MKTCKPKCPLSKEKVQMLNIMLDAKKNVGDVISLIASIARYTISRKNKNSSYIVFQVVFHLDTYNEPVNTANCCTVTLVPLLYMQTREDAN